MSGPTTSAARKIVSTSELVHRQRTMGDYRGQAQFSDRKLRVESLSLLEQEAGFQMPDAATVSNRSDC